MQFIRYQKFCGENEISLRERLCTLVYHTWMYKNKSGGDVWFLLSKSTVVSLACYMYFNPIIWQYSCANILNSRCSMFKINPWYLCSTWNRYVSNICVVTNILNTKELNINHYCSLWWFLFKLNLSSNYPSLTFTKDKYFKINFNNSNNLF